jgi:hypothetical protein
MVREGRGNVLHRGGGVHTCRIRLKNETTCERFRMEESSERRRGSSWKKDKKAGSQEKESMKWKGCLEVGASGVWSGGERH